MDGLTAEDIQKLSAPFQPDEYGIRVGAKDKKDGKWVMWLVYVEEDAIVDRLNAVTPNWTWEIRNVQSGDGYIAAYGRLTINGVSREGVGTGSPDTGTKIGENEEKGAATDALKRCARLFGIGLELKREDFGRVKTDGPNDDWKAKAEALKKFTAEYNKIFGSKQSAKPAPIQRQAVQQSNITPLNAEPTADPSFNEMFPKSDAKPFAKSKRDLAYEETNMRHNYGHRQHFNKLMDLLASQDKVHAGMTVEEIVAAIDAHYAAKVQEKVASGQ